MVLNSAMKQVVISRKFNFSCGVDSPRSKYGTGHNYIAEVHVLGPIDPVSGLVVNLPDLKQVIQHVINELDHKHLNRDVRFFYKRKVTPALIAEYCYQRISTEFHMLSGYQSLHLLQVQIMQGDNMWGAYGESKDNPDLKFHL